MLIFALFTFFALILIVTSIKSYRTVSATSDENNQLRSTITYISSKLRSADDGSVITVENIDDVQVLSIEYTLEGEKYKNYLYVVDGEMEEQLLDAKDRINLSDGNYITKIHSVDVEKVSDGLLKITAVTNSLQQREAYVNLYCDK